MGIINSCIFEKNIAEKGGAIFYDSPFTSEQEFIVNGTEFKDNHARLEGGAIKYTGRPLTLD